MNGQSHLVLIVDDDRDFLEITRGMLERGGYRVIVAADPMEAWSAIVNDQPDLVITDLMMQTKSSGFGLARRIKETPQSRDVPVIIMSSVGSRLGYDFVPHTLNDLTAMHADAFLEKPAPADDLLAQVAGLLSVAGRKKGT